MAAGSQAREQAYGQDTTSISDKQRIESQSLLPEATVTGKSFKDKLNAVADKIFNMQSNDPEGYAAMLSGLDLYSRSQTQDFATAMLGNNKYNKDQAAALMQANMNATTQKLNEMKVLKAEKDMTAVEAASTSEIEVAKGIVGGKVDKDDVDSIANYIAGDAKVLMQSIPGLAYNQAVVIAFQQAQQSGILEQKGFFKKRLQFNPNAAVIKSYTLKQLQDANPGLSEEAIRKQAKADGVTIR
jgi:hypothetical protein